MGLKNGAHLNICYGYSVHGHRRTFRKPGFYDIETEEWHCGICCHGCIAKIISLKTEKLYRWIFLGRENGNRRTEEMGTWSKIFQNQLDRRSWNRRKSFWNIIKNGTWRIRSLGITQTILEYRNEFNVNKTLKPLCYIILREWYSRKLCKEGMKGENNILKDGEAGEKKQKQNAGNKWVRHSLKKRMTFWNILKRLPRRKML